MGFLIFLGVLLLVAYVLVGWYLIYKGVEAGAGFLAGLFSKRNDQDSGPFTD
jgi:hypothetical protein